MIYHSPRKRAFTLLEMLISIAIFMIFFGIVAGSYVTLVSANRKANEAQKVYREVRFIFDTIADNLRNGTLDYTCIDTSNLDVACVENQNSEEKKVLAVLREKGQKRILFKFDDTKLLMMEQERVLDEGTALTSWSSKKGWQSLGSDKLLLNSVSFLVFPSHNPYEATYAADDSVQWQPTVTVKLETSGHHFRTTYSSRTYGRKSIYE